MAGGMVNKDFAISVEAMLAKHASRDMQKQIKDLLRNQILEIDPKISKRGLERAVKDAFRSGSFYLDEIDKKIKGISYNLQTAPGQMVSGQLERIKAWTDKEGVFHPEKWVASSQNYAFTKNANLKVYEQMYKNMANTTKLLAQAEKVGNTKAFQSLNKDLQQMQKSAKEFWDTIKGDLSAEQQKNIQTRMSKLLGNAGIIRENTQLTSAKKEIAGMVKEIENLSKAQSKMARTDDAWDRTNKKINEQFQSLYQLVGANEDLQKYAKDKIDKSQINKQSANEAKAVNDYIVASKERLKVEEKILQIRDKMRKDSTLNTSETREYLKGLSDYKKQLSSAMTNIENGVKGSAVENSIRTLKDGFNTQLDLIEKKTMSVSSKTKNFLKDISTGWKDAAARVIDYTIAYRTLWGGIQLFQDGIATIYQLNKAFTDIQMVTGYSNENIDKLAKSYGNLAINMGSTIEQVAQGATEWLRQGKTVEETNTLLEQSMILSKVGAMESAEATEYLTSTINGYKMEVEDASKIVDVFSALDMSAATSAKELALAFQRSANSAKDAGIPFEKLAEYITIVSETTRKSASTIGESFKTLSARYMNVKLGKVVDEETGENLNDVEKALKTVGITIRTNNNTWRDFGEVIDEVGNNWSNYNDLQKNTIVTAMAGVRQAENLRALFNNFEKMGKYEEVVANAQGSAMQKYGTYLESLEAKQNRLISTWQSIAYDPTFEQLLKVFIDIGTAIGTGIKHIGLLSASLGALSGVAGLTGSKFSALKLNIGDALHSFGLFNPVMLKTMKNMRGSAFDTVAFEQALKKTNETMYVTKAYMAGMGMSTIKFAGAMIAATVKTVALQVAVTALNMALGMAVGFAISAVIQGLINYAHRAEIAKQKIQDLKDAVDTSTSTIASYGDEISTNADKIEELEKLKDTQGITVEQEKELQLLKDKNEQLKIQIELERELQETNQGELNNKLLDSINDSGSNPLQGARHIKNVKKSYTSGSIGSIESQLSTLDGKIADRDAILDKDNRTEKDRENLESLNAEIKDITDSITAENRELTANSMQLKGNSDEVRLTKAQVEQLQTKLKDEYGIFFDLSDVIADNTDSLADMEETASELSDTLSSLTSSLASIKQAEEEAKELGYISSETLASLIKQYPQLTTVLMQYQAGLISTADVIKAMKGEYDADLDSYKSVILEKLKYDGTLYQRMKDNNKDALIEIGKGRKADLESCHTLAEAKLKLESTLISQLGTKWAKYYNVTLDTMTKDYTNLMLKAQTLWAQSGTSTSRKDNPAQQANWDAYQQIVSDTGQIEDIINSHREAVSALEEIGRENVDIKISDKPSSGSKSDPLKETEKEYKDRLSLSKNWIDERNAQNDWGADNEIAAWERVRTYTEDYYRQGLISYQTYAESLHDINMNIFNAQKAAFEKQQKDLETVRDKMIDYLEAYYDKLKKEEDRKHDDILENIDDERKALEDAYEAQDYQNDIAKKDKAIMEKKAELEALALDNSAEGMARKAQLQDELDELLLEKDEAVEEQKRDNAEDTLDALEEMEDDRYTEASRKLDDASEEMALFNQAQEDLANMTVTEIMNKYGDMAEYIGGIYDGLTEKMIELGQNAINNPVTNPDQSAFSNVSKSGNYWLANADGSRPAGAGIGDYIVTGGGVFKIGADGKGVFDSALKGTSTGKTTSYTELKNIFTKYYAQYKDGGLLSQTGLFWGDGTKQNPEYVLKSQDFKDLKSILDFSQSLLPSIGKYNIDKQLGSINCGNNVFDIDINSVPNESIRELVERIKREIWTDLDAKMRLAGIKVLHNK